MSKPHPQIHCVCPAFATQCASQLAPTALALCLGVFVDFVDQTLLRLAGAATRAAVFDQLALEHLVSAGYDAAALGVAGPYQPVFDELRLGISLPAAPRLEGTWQQAGRSEITELRLALTGLGDDPIRIDGLWRGAIIARKGALESPITSVTGQWADLSLDAIDAEIVGALGALPNPPLLEQERRSRLLGRLQQGLAHPGEVTDGTLASWLREQGADSVGTLLARSRGQLQTAGLTVTFAAPPPPLPLPRPMAVTVAILIREAGTSIAELLGVSHRAQERLQMLGAVRPQTTAGLRHRVLIGWLLPVAVLNDTGWPGADAAARRLAANAWLGSEGVALIPVS